MNMFEFDHLAISCTDLEAGAATIEALLGVPLAPGGRHPDFGTHNRLLSLGGEEYLEVIAIDPAAPAPGRPRWFGLDAFSGGPRLTNWILRSNDMDRALALAHPGTGTPMALERGAYRWRMAVPAAGAQPMDNCHPALIAWDSAHPAPALPESACRLHRLVVRHPEAPGLFQRMGLADPRIRAEAGPPELVAEIETPTGLVRLP